MRALVKSRPERGLWLEEVPVPTPGINDVLIRVLLTGICGTDLHIYEWDEWAQANDTRARWSSATSLWAKLSQSDRMSRISTRAILSAEKATWFVAAVAIALQGVVISARTRWAWASIGPAHLPSTLRCP